LMSSSVASDSATNSWCLRISPVFAASVARTVVVVVGRVCHCDEKQLCRRGSVGGGGRFSKNRESVCATKGHVRVALTGVEFRFIVRHVLQVVLQILRIPMGVINKRVCETGGLFGGRRAVVYAAKTLARRRRRRQGKECEALHCRWMDIGTYRLHEPVLIFNRRNC
jgi:hypothetical protein